MFLDIYRALRVWVCLLAAGLQTLCVLADPLVCDPSDLSFGVVDAATGNVQQAFVLSNQGPDVLLIDEVSSPCGCVSMQLATNRLAAGERTSLSVVIDLRRRRGVQRLAAHVGYHAQGREGAEATYLKLSLHGTVAGTNTVASAEREPAVTGRMAAGLRQVVVELFGEAGCEACDTVRREILPVARRMLGDRGRIIERDVFETTNYLALAKYQDRFGVLGTRRNDPVSMVVDGNCYLGGVEEIRSRLPDVLRQRLAAADMPLAQESQLSREAPEDLAASRLAAFSVAGVALAGLLDGVNPCAFATVIFLASLLAIVRVRGSGVLLLGGGFLVGTFLTYFLLGLGLFHGLKALTAWRAVAQALDLSMAALLVLLAALSFRDAWRFSRTGRASDVTVRLSDSLRNRVHGMLRRRITPGGLAGSGLATGAVVTVLESVCTGQVYVPTLMAVARDPVLRPHALGLLAVYNLAFLVPVAVVMLAAWRGTTSFALANWSRHNAVWGKVLLAVFFLALAALILMT